VRTTSRPALAAATATRTAMAAASAARAAMAAAPAARAAMAATAAACATIAVMALPAAAGDVERVDAAAFGQAAPGEQTPRAGLVIQLGDGTVYESCVELGAPEITGLELLQRSGLDVRYEIVGGGAQVCSIGGHGCAAPEPCWCQCQVVGPDCKYWAYHTLEDGAWEYARVGATSRVVRHGDVDGWAWGAGTATSGAAPPVRAFDDLCGEAKPAPHAPTATSPTREAPTPAATDPAPEPTHTVPPSSSGAAATAAPSRAPKTAETQRQTDAAATAAAPGARDAGSASPSRVPLGARRTAVSSGAATAPADRAATGSGGDATAVAARPIDVALRATSDAEFATVVALAYASAAGDSRTPDVTGSRAEGGVAQEGSGQDAGALGAAVGMADTAAGPADATADASGRMSGDARAGDGGSRRTAGGPAGQQPAAGAGGEADAGRHEGIGRLLTAGAASVRDIAGYVAFVAVVVCLLGLLQWSRKRRSRSLTD